MSETVLVNGESVEMTEEQREDLGLGSSGDPMISAAKTLTVGTLWDRLSDDEWDALDTAMSGEHVRLRRLWQTPSHTMTEGDNLWTVIAGHLEGIVSAERRADLLT